MKLMSATSKLPPLICSRDSSDNSTPPPLHFTFKFFSTPPPHFYDTPFAMSSQLHNGTAAAASHPPLSSLHLPHRRRRRSRLIILLLRLITFALSLASAIFTATISSPSWLRFQSFRFVFAANAIVAAYSFFEICAAAHEVVRDGATLFPEPMQLIFDYGHDQAFAYMGMAAGAAGAADVRRLRAAGECATRLSGFCVQADVAVVLGFMAFAFLALASLVSGFRLVCYLVTGSRFHSR